MRTWTRAGRVLDVVVAALAALVVLAGCAGSTPTASPAAASAASPVPAGTSARSGTSGTSGTPASPAVTNSSAVTEVRVAVQKGRVQPPPGRVPVERGTRVRISVTSDVADHVHVHGYDQAAALPPGEAAVLEFVADTPGLFEVETHESHLQLLSLLVR